MTPRHPQRLTSTSRAASSRAGGPGEPYAHAYAQRWARQEKSGRAHQTNFVRQRLARLGAFWRLPGDREAHGRPGSPLA